MKNKILALAIVSLFMVSVGAAQLGSDPELQEYQEPDISVNQNENTVTATFYLENTGGSFANIGDDSWIIEIQPKLQNRFSFTDSLSTIGVSDPDTCDDSRPENVHKSFVFDVAEQKEITITSPLNGEGTLEPGQYNLRALTVTGCNTGDTAESNVLAKEPYGWGEKVGEFTVKTDDTVSDPSQPENNVWISYSNSNECLEVSEGSAPTGMTTYDSKQSCLEEQGEDNQGFTLTELVIGVSLSIAAVLITLFGLRRLDIIG